MQLLNSPEIVELAGLDARAFAQAQFCNDVDSIVPGACQMSAWLNAQGKVRALFHLYCLASDRYLMLLRGGKATDVARALTPFVFRSKLRILHVTDWLSYGQIGSDQRDDAALGQSSLRIPLPCSTRIVHLFPKDSEADLPTDAINDDEWNRADLREGLPSLPPLALEQFLPAWLDLERLGAISYRKGCYPGQEIVARMHFRGVGMPRRLAWVRYQSDRIPIDEVLRDPFGAAFAWILNRSANVDRSIDALAVLTGQSAVAGPRMLDQTGTALEVISTQWTR